MQFPHRFLGLAAVAVAAAPLASAQTARILVTGTVSTVTGVGGAGTPFTEAGLGDSVVLELIVSVPGQAQPIAGFAYEIHPTLSSLTIGEQRDTLLSPTSSSTFVSLTDDDPTFGDILNASTRFASSPTTSVGILRSDLQGNLWDTDVLEDLAGSEVGGSSANSSFRIWRPLGGLNFRLDSIEFDASIGTSYCDATVNSTGAVGELSGFGTAMTALNDLTVIASELPPGATGFFLISPQAGFIVNPGGSLGNLCLGGAIGRYVGAGEVQAADAAGRISLDMDLNSIPTPSGPTAGMPGDILNVQLWHRDIVAGQVVSNLTRGLTFTLQ